MQKLAGRNMFGIWFLSQIVIKNNNVMIPQIFTVSEHFLLIILWISLRSHCCKINMTIRLQVTTAVELPEKLHTSSIWIEQWYWLAIPTFQNNDKFKNKSSACYLITRYTYFCKLVHRFNNPTPMQYWRNAMIYMKLSIRIFAIFKCIFSVKGTIYWHKILLDMKTKLSLFLNQTASMHASKFLGFI